MMAIRQHIPNFCSGADEYPSATFETEEQLVAIPFVKRWLDVDFERFSVALTSYDECYLMLECKDGSFWVVGYMDQVPAFLPEWKAPDERKVS